MEKKEMNKLIVAVIAVALVVAIVGGSTFAYWQWVTSTEQQTLVNVTVQDGISMTITPTTTQTNVLYPVTRDNCGLASITGYADVTVNNSTGVESRPQFYLKLRIEDKNGNVITANQTSYTEDGTKTYAEYINFAVAEYYELDSDGKETSTESSYTCANAPRVGAYTTTTTKDQFKNDVTGWVDSPLITNLTGTGSEEAANRYPILSSVSGNENSITYVVSPNSVGTHRFKFWAWIDSSYTFENVGTEVTDPLQDAKITISWSDASIVKQGA